MAKARFATVGVLGVVVAAAATGCAAGGHAVGAARAARYHGDRLAMFAALRSAVAAKYPLASSDETALRIETRARWYSPEGLGTTAEPSHDLRDMPDRSIHMKLMVALVPHGPDSALWMVSIEPTMMRYFTGRPNPDRLTLDDPSVPGWAIGKVDQLHAAIHEALQPYEVVRPGRGPASDSALPGPGQPPPQATQLLPR